MMYTLNFASSSSTSLPKSGNSSVPNLKRPAGPERAFSDSVTPQAQASSKSSMRNMSSPFKKTWSSHSKADDAASIHSSSKEHHPAPRDPSLRPSTPLSTVQTHNTTSSSHAHSSSVPFLSASNARHSALMDPRASLLIRQRTSSSPGSGVQTGAMHVARLANGNIRTFAAKAKRHWNDLSHSVGPSSSSSSNSQATDAEQPARTASPLARLGKGLPGRNRSASQPLNNLTLDPTKGKRDASSPASASPASPREDVFGIRLPRETAKRSQVFGYPLQDAVRLTRLLSVEQVRLAESDTSLELSPRDRARCEAKAYLPAIAIRCMEYIEDWVSEEGLYRVPGSHLQVQRLKALFNSGLDLDLREISTSELDPHSVTGVFKLWLRELPHAILSPDVEPLVDGLMQQELGLAGTTARQGIALAPSAHGRPGSTSESISNPSSNLIDKLSIVLSTLSLDRWHLLHELVHHLALLASYAHVNKMTLSNLRLILSPTLRLTPAMLQILVDQRHHLFDRSRAHQLASPTSSTFAGSTPLAAQHGDASRSAPADLAMSIFAQQQQQPNTLLQAEWKSQVLPSKRLSTQSGPLPPIATRFAGSIATPADRSPSPASTSSARSRTYSRSNGSVFWASKQAERSDAASLSDRTQERTSSSGETIQGGPRKSYSLSDLNDPGVQFSPALQTPRAQAHERQHSETDESEAEDLDFSSASSTSDREATRSVLTVETSAEEDDRAPVPPTAKVSNRDRVNKKADDATEILGHQRKDAPRTASPVPSLSLSVDDFGSSLLGGDDLWDLHSGRP